MKIRNGFVSNSSSSCFIIAGKKILEILKQFFNDTTKIFFDDEYYDKQEDITYGAVNKAIYKQCKKSTAEDVKSVIHGLFQRSVYYFTVYQFYKIVSNVKCNCYIGDYGSDFTEDKIYNNSFEHTMFELDDEVKNVIIDEMTKYYHETKSEKEYEYHNVVTECLAKLSDLLEDLIDGTFYLLKAQNDEVYVVSFGDNHGECHGKMGAFVEWNYLGDKEINERLKTNFKIYQLDCH